MNNSVKQPTFITHKKLIGNLYLILIDNIINYFCSSFNINNDIKLELIHFIYKKENLDKILKINTTKKLRNSLINN